jgi:hypothetical protein
VVIPLRELARATGARLIVDGGDLTDAPVSEIVEVLT